MRLLSMTVRNFRSLTGTKTTVSFLNSDIIFLIGQNNTGKSSVLDAYEYLVTPKKKAAPSDFYGFKPNAPIEIDATFLKESGDAEIFNKKGLDKWVAPNDHICFRKTWTSPDTEGQKQTLDPSTGKYVDNGFGGLETHLATEAPTPIRIPAMPTPDDLSKFVTDVLKKLVLKTLHNDELVTYDAALSAVQRLQEKVYSNTKVAGINQRANDSFQKVFPDLTLAVRPEENAPPDLAKFLEKEFSVTVQDKRLPNVDQPCTSNGHGVVRQAIFNFLGIVKNDLPTDLASDPAPKKKFLLLFEEPEIYLHPAAISRLRRRLYELCIDSPFQFLCASHSPSLIDLSKPQTSLVRVERAAGSQTAMHQVGRDVFASTAERKQRVQMINRFNPHVCEVFFADNVVVVEGDTEAIVVRYLLAKADPTSEVFVLNSGSKNNIPFFQEVLTHFAIRHHVLHDADCRYQYSRDNFRVLNKDNSPRANSAWALNQEIWDGITRAQEVDPGLARRFVFNRNFEHAHGYTYDEDKGKPLSAYEFACSLSADSKTPVQQFVSELLSIDSPACEFSPGDLDSLVIEPDGAP